jgi:hypothetical protein
MSEVLRLENVVIAYPHLIEKHTPPGSTQAKYSIECILDPQRHEVLIQCAEEAFKKAAVEAGKGDKIQFLENPVRYGDELNAQQQRKGNKQLIGESQRSMIFGGCICNVFVDFYWSKNTLNPGVFVGLKGVQLVDNVNVEKLGGGAPSVDSMFEVVDGPAPLVGEAGDVESWM